MFQPKTSMRNPALNSLNRLLGTWYVFGEIHGRITFNWMEGRFFMVKDIDLVGTKGIEFIGYDKTTEKLKSHYFDNNGCIMECTYEVSETNYIVLIDMPGIKGVFNGKFSNDGKTITGVWDWVNSCRQISYSIVLTGMR